MITIVLCLLCSLYYQEQSYKVCKILAFSYQDVQVSADLLSDTALPSPVTSCTEITLGMLSSLTTPEKDTRNLRLGRILEVLIFLDWQLSKSVCCTLAGGGEKKKQNGEKGNNYVIQYSYPHPTLLSAVHLLASQQQACKARKMHLKEILPKYNLDLISSFSYHRHGN